MSGFKQLSEYFSDDGRKKADIVKELGTNRYIVRVMNDAGSAFSASFENEDDAEEYAEAWVQ
jgi:hypothetical protein